MDVAAQLLPGRFSCARIWYRLMGGDIKQTRLMNTIAARRQLYATWHSCRLDASTTRFGMQRQCWKAEAHLACLRQDALFCVTSDCQALFNCRRPSVYGSAAQFCGAVSQVGRHTGTRCRPVLLQYAASAQASRPTAIA
jgi:hypothetical protein